jgi:hypothetical protein
MTGQVEARRVRNIRWDIDPGDEEIRQLVKRLERDFVDMLNAASARLQPHRSSVAAPPGLRW